ncbi:uncharacterized protein VTP21DRAFT_299 [Calcarisporiella thermophila]|uniref:uncharacterized protein n=1 Tax=Calcarisporiella thermophila TaxID=911321 RepID=UPI003743EF09
MAPVSSIPSSIPPLTWIASFDLSVYVYYVLFLHLVPYLLFWCLAPVFNWERTDKSPARHFEDLRKSFMYGVVLFVFGNYTQTFGWIMVVAFYPTLFIYVIVSQFPWAKFSLPQIRDWPPAMWILAGSVLSIILAAGGFHIYLAYRGGPLYLGLYLGSLLIPALLFAAAALALEEQNHGWIRQKLREYFGWGRARGHSSEDSLEQAAESREAQESASANHPRVSFHIHHWIVFYTLAFYTQFGHPVSQVAAGCAFACYMEGIIAYGYDSLLLTTGA